MIKANDTDKLLEQEIKRAAKFLADAATKERKNFWWDRLKELQARQEHFPLLGCERK